MGRMFINLIKDIKDKVDIQWCPLQKTFFNMLLEAYIQIYITFLVDLIVNQMGHHNSKWMMFLSVN